MIILMINETPPLETVTFLFYSICFIFNPLAELRMIIDVNG